MPTHPSFTFRKQFNLQHLGGWMEALSEPMTLKFEHCRHFLRQCIYPPNSIILYSIIRKLSRTQSNTETNKRTRRFSRQHPFHCAMQCQWRII